MKTSARYSEAISEILARGYSARKGSLKMGSRILGGPFAGERRPVRRGTSKTSMRLHGATLVLVLQSVIFLPPTLNARNRAGAAIHVAWAVHGLVEPLKAAADAPAIRRLPRCGLLNKSVHPQPSL